MTRFQKAIANLDNNGITAFEEDGVIYVEVNEYNLEISQFEISFQADEYDRNLAEETE
jgi:hypothetical protein